MARSKKMDALAPREETALANWDEELAKHAVAASEKEVLGGKQLSVRAGILNIAGEAVEGNKLKVIVLASVFKNAFYEGKFDPDNVQSPTCAAVAEEEEQLAPAEDVEFKQHDTCKGCAQNEWGTADTGKGKACKNGRQIAILAGDDLSVDALRNGEMLTFNIPVTSVAGWKLYVKGLASNFKRPPFALVTEIAPVPDPKTQFRVTFKACELIPASVGALIMRRREEALKELLRAPPTLTTAAKEATTKEAAPKGKAKGKKGKF